MERLYAQRGAWSVWRILRHPKIACGIIDESVMMMENLDKNLLIANKDLDEHRILCLKLTAERDALAATLKERDDELLKVRDDLERITMELEDARDELLTHRSVDAKLAEFNQQLVKVEEMDGKHIAVFRIQILFRDHYTWQGRLIWQDEETETVFHSCLELMQLIDEILAE